MDGFVLDASVAVAWCFPDEHSARALAVLKSLTPDFRALVPSLWPLEVANVLLVGERRKRSSQADTTTWLSFLAALPITVDDETHARAWSETLSIARAASISVYDAAYLDLAMRRGLPLATLDEKLKSAASAIGIALYAVPPLSFEIS
jgi:predicted nucleic acid-binding protein